MLLLVISAQPLMPLSQDLFVTINKENKDQFIENTELNEQMAEKNFEAFQQRSIPWTSFFSALALVAAWIVIASNPERKLIPETPEKSEEELLKEASERLKQIVDNAPTDPEKYSTYLLQLDAATRMYLRRKHHLDASILTTEEFIIEMGKKGENLDSSTLHLFNLTDQIKYADQPPIIEMETCDYLWNYK